MSVREAQEVVAQADSLWHNGDTLLYYYDLNNMAFEKAYLAEKQATYRLIQ